MNHALQHLLTLPVVASDRTGTFSSAPVVSPAHAGSMKFTFSETITSGELILHVHNPSLDRLFFIRDRNQKYLSIAWNTGDDQVVTIDEIPYTFPAHTMLPLMVSQSYHFERAQEVIAWQFNREFYCIIDHDKEVSCSGFLFYGSAEPMFIRLSAEEGMKMEHMVREFKEEINHTDAVQATMLRSLLVRLIIHLTRLAKVQHVQQDITDDSRFDIIRKFNMLVENNYRTQHQVKFYSAELNRAPKTLANVFARYGGKSPLQIIQDRIIIEAKRLYHYTDKSTKEIAAELGFDDAAHFSRFFKNQTGLNPSTFRIEVKSKSREVLAAHREEHPFSTPA